MAKAILICGRLCSGKTVYAERLRAENGAVVLSVDELMIELFGLYAGEKHDEYTARIQRYLLEKSVEILSAGTDVILDWGFWTKETRAEARAFYRSRGFPSELHWLNISDEVWRERIARRNELVASGKAIAYYVDDNLMQKFQTLFEAPDPEEIDVRVTEPVRRGRMDTAEIRERVLEQLPEEDLRSDGERSAALLRLTGLLLKELRENPAVFTESQGEDLRSALQECENQARTLLGFVKRYGATEPEDAAQAAERLRQRAARIREQRSAPGRVEEKDISPVED